MRIPSITLGLGTGLLTIALDQLSKYAMMRLLVDQPQMEIAPFFDLVLVWNKGISFGMLATRHAELGLVTMSAVIVVILLLWLARTPYKLVACALGLIIGGALGNVIDRLRLGAVVDFIDLHLGTAHWPAFNIADSGIFIGVVLLCLHSMFIEPRHTKDRAP